jgi:Leucine-rich repeat (LRR) protein
LHGFQLITSAIFDNLKNPTNIKALIIEDCNIATLAADAFAPLASLEILNINQNLIADLPSGIFASNPKLKQFSMFGAGSKPGLLTSLPEDLFTPTPDIERIILYGHSGLTAFPANIFKGLSKCEIISFVACSLSEAGFPDFVFSDLVSLQWFDFFGNQITKVESRWFDGNWAGRVLRVALNNNPITVVENGAFDSLVSAENIYLHKTSITTLPAGLFDNNVNLISYTLAD